MIVDLSKHWQSQPPREARTNLFAMATVYAATGSMPVKVRNLSSTGARIEGPVLPPEDAQICLRRGDLEVSGKIIWCREGNAGVRFDSKVKVADWLPRGRASAPQQRIDRVVHEARQSSAVASPSVVAHLPDSIPTELELLRLRQAIEMLADDLANDPVVLERYGHKLQVLDMAASALRKLATQTLNAPLAPLACAAKG